MSLFGGSEKVDLLTAGQRSLLNDLTGRIQDNLGVAPETYGGPVVPGLSRQQSRGLGIADMVDPNRIPGLDGAISDMVAGRGAGPFDSEGYYRDAVYNPAKLALDDELRQIEARYGSSGGVAGGFGEAIGAGVARFGTGIGQVMADLAREERTLADARRSGGVQAAFGRSNDIASSAAALLGPIGGTERGVQAELNLGDLNAWQASQDYNNPWLGFVGPALGTQAYGIGQQQGIIPGIAGAAGALLGGAGSFMTGMAA